MASYAPFVDEGASDGQDVVLHALDGDIARATHKPLQINHPEPVEFESDNFKGRLLFLHRPVSTYDNAETAETYPYKGHFHGRKRLWEMRFQGKFKRRPGMLFCGIELENYVAVNFATRTLMRGLLPLLQSALQCKLVHHEVGRPNDSDLRPVVVAPIWAADNTLVHGDSSDVPDIAALTLPTGLGRKAARRFWETLWDGGGPSWDCHLGGPTFTFAIWGPSPLVDLRAWVFRKLPLMWGKDISLEPFCGQQPVYGVMYELSGGRHAKEHRQPQKIYSVMIRIMPEAVWTNFTMGSTDDAGPEVSCLRPAFLAAAGESALWRRDSVDTESFCSALSRSSSDDDLENQASEAVSEDTCLRSPSSQLPRPLVSSPTNRGRSQERSSLSSFFGGCCRRRRRRLPGADLLI